MHGLMRDAGEFSQRKHEHALYSAQAAALTILCGVDLDAALSVGASERGAIVARLGRLIERERLKGAARHWSYDLNRHIALKQARDRLRAIEI